LHFDPYFCQMEPNLEAISNQYMLSFEAFQKTVLEDYRTALASREVSLLGRREVLTGKAKFGIFGDGKEIAQVALAKFFQKGDFRSGYYRDQTLMFALGTSNVPDYFAQLYADVENDPYSGGRNMNSHFSTPFVNEKGEWLPLANSYNVSADIAPTAGQMVRGLGLAFASKFFRNANPDPDAAFDGLTNQGNEVCFCTIGDASTSEGHFWETINAAGVLQVPLAVIVYDDGYGISVPTELQTTKGSISEALAGFEKKPGTNGIKIFTVNGWDYAALCETFEEGVAYTRTTHTPVVFHVKEVTQPQGHSTSGSHERYKSAERLEWERNWDCNKQMRDWLILNELATAESLDLLESEVKQEVRDQKQVAWDQYINPIKSKIHAAAELVFTGLDQNHSLYRMMQELVSSKEPLKRDLFRILNLVLEQLPAHPNAKAIAQLLANYHIEQAPYYSKYLYNEGPKSALNVPVMPAVMDANPKQLNGYEVLNQYFDYLFANNPKVVAFGEDLGNIGDVNQGFAGLQAKYGVNRIFDTGIREQTIMGQAHGLAMRGLRPIAEIQYLDYLMYGIQTLSDDVATLHYRTVGRQSSPVIIRTRGHRLEGIFHSGSPMGMIINSLRGMFVCVPRNMVQAVGMYNTLLQANDPAILIECLNGYRLKETVPSNINTFNVPFGMPEILRAGEDITIVSYGSTLRIVEDAALRLASLGIDCEIIDVQTLLPFDINHQILASLKKTNRILFVDEDVPGGATAFMFQQVIEGQGGYKWLDASARTLSAKAHRPAYASDGDYFSKPNAEEVIQVVKEMMAE
jgi:pyruvate/2-oxoglutarate/acetoin dehydrogenase E1 component/TPP-dependent pyruvate/acetoin dehydrogenase alpha subunit